ncbi:hypothetical protein H2203_007460 [Taxawa tesnikishii (nom. ined.)]|nr:hypothetical protein H2203_007460 [Dothideales sp. JES 119]
MPNYLRSARSITGVHRLSPIRPIKTMDQVPRLNFFSSHAYSTKKPTSKATLSTSALRPRSDLPYPLGSSTYVPFNPVFSRRYYGRSSASSSFSAQHAFYLILGVNSLVFGAWQYAYATRNSRLLYRLRDNTIISASAWDSGRYWTVLTSAFTHQQLGHFVFNMFAMNTFCSMLGWVPGLTGVGVLGIAVGAGVAGSYGFVVRQKAKVAQQGGPPRLNSQYHGGALGASGAVMGLAAVATCFFPTAPMQLMFIPINIPLWAITVGYAAIDGYYLDSQDSRTAHAGHLGD